jgi:hypothetical protein
MVVGIMIATEYHLASPATKFISQTDPQRVFALHFSANEIPRYLKGSEPMSHPKRVLYSASFSLDFPKQNNSLM